jgi:hypothetical protein
LLHTYVPYHTLTHSRKTAMPVLPAMKSSSLTQQFLSYNYISFTMVIISDDTGFYTLNLCCR